MFQVRLPKSTAIFAKKQLILGKKDPWAFVSPFLRVVGLRQYAWMTILFIPSILFILFNPVKLKRNIRVDFILDLVVHALAFYAAVHNFAKVTKDGNNFFFVDVRTCAQWQISAVTVTLAWLNLLFYMRMLSFVGTYILLFQDVIRSFLKVFFVVFIFVMAFASGFHMLLSHREGFEFLGDSVLKTIVMMSGEMEYGEIFFKEIPPEGFGENWDQGHEHVPFPFFTYGIFISFFFLVSIVALNVMLGLAVDDIQKSLKRANFQRLKMRLIYILEKDQIWSISIAKSMKLADLDLKFLKRATKLQHEKNAITNDIKEGEKDYFDS